VENLKNMTQVESNFGRWKLDTTKMLKKVLKTKKSWLECSHQLFPQIFFERGA